MNYKYKEEKGLSILVGILVFIVFAIGSIDMISSRRISNTFNRNREYHTHSNSSGNVGQQNNLGTTSLEDLGIQDDYKATYHHSLDVYTLAEDPEYWEIEQFNGTYYRVRREDYDDDWYGHYEFDTEEPIGDAAALYKYAKDHNIIPQ